MSRFMQLFFILLVGLFLTGCAGNAKKIMDNQTIPIVGITRQYHANDIAFAYLNTELRAENAFSDQEAGELEKSQLVILYVMERVEARQRKGDLSYSEVFYSYQIARDAYLDMQAILDEHFEVFKPPVQVVYVVTRREVNRLIGDVNNLLITAEQEIDQKSFDLMTEKIGQFVGALQPFVGVLI